MKSFNYYDLLELFAQPETGCAICARLKVETERYLTALLYEYSVDFATHQNFRAARGLCNVHAWQMIHTREGLINVAVLYEAAVDEALTLLSQMTAPTPRNRLGRMFGSGEGEALAAKLTADQPCLCCQMVSQAEQRYFEALVDGLSDPRFVEAWQQSDGLCLPHLIGVVRAIKDPARLTVIVNRQKVIWTKMKAELGLYILRYGASGNDEAMGD
ncbi:MAG: hypothetical protein H7X77_02025, partial [Anaerolineae bacterium]|nr:hypothetical protein [Anaerolineae bacterium]